jgi:hypothetical protein
VKIKPKIKNTKDNQPLVKTLPKNKLFESESSSMVCQYPYKIKLLKLAPFGAFDYPDTFIPFL